MNNSRKKWILFWFIMGFVEPPLMWLFLMWYTNLFDFSQVFFIALNPLLWLYVGSFLVGLFFIVRNKLKKIEALFTENAESNKYQNILISIPWLFMISEIIYCLIGPNTGLLTRIPFGSDYFFAWIIGIPIILVYSMPFFILMMSNLENWAQPIPVLENKMLLSLRQKLYICIFSSAIGTMMMIAICVFIILNKGISDGVVVIDLASLFQKMLFIFVISAFGILLPYVILIQKIVRQIRKTLDFAKDIATGDLTNRVVIEERDEIGSLLSELNVMTDTIEDIISESNTISQSISDGNLNTRGDEDKFEGAYQDVVNGFNNALDALRIVKEIMMVLHDASEGQLSVKVTGDYKGDFSDMKESVNRMIDALAIREIMSVVKLLGEGDISRKVEGEYKGDFVEMKEIVNTMLEYIQLIIDQADTIANGDFSTAIKPKSDQDFLGQSLANMTDKLRDMTESNEEQMKDLKKMSELNNDQMWIKDGQTGLAAVMRGEQNIPDLAREIITYIAKYLDLPLGLIYLVDENNLIKLVGSYAYKKRKSVSNEFNLGEGLVGQASLEKESITINEVPEDYIHVQSGLGSAIPSSVQAIPFLLNDQVKGVIEIATFKPLSELQSEFLKRVTESVAIAFHTAQAREKMATLLNATQQQSKELEAQQLKLKESNVELQTQTKALKKSEEDLKVQQEELQTANEELEEKSKLLEEQRDEISGKNITLENAQLTLEEKAKELEITSKYKSEFLANMSHELRTPLNSIIILSKLLADNKNKSLSAKEADSAKTVYSSSKDLLSLINEILDLSKIEAGHLDIFLEEIKLTQLCDRLSETFQPVANNKKLEFGIDIHPKAPATIISDQKRIHQVLKNFLSNAFKFTEKGSVVIAVTQPDPDMVFLRSDLTPKDTVAFSVIDSGIGIPEDKLKVIFESFQQVDGSISRKYGGTGLGLSISRELAKKLGGEIQVKSQPNQGTTFTLYLPIKISAPENVPTAAPVPQIKVEPKSSNAAKPVKVVKTGAALSDDRNHLKHSDKSILIIEDDPVFAKILSEVAQERSFKLLLSQDGEEGLALAQKHLPNAIILDIHLPGMSGWIVMDRLKDDPNTRHIPVHFISGTDYKLDALKRGAIGFLQKPVEMDMLQTVFQKIESVTSKDIKDLLIIEDDQSQQKSLEALLGSKDISISAVDNGKDAIASIKQKQYDCIILDLGLPDVSGFELLEQISEAKENAFTPVIIYTGKELSQDETAKLKKYSESVIVKDVESQDRLLDETSLFLHRIEKNLPKEMQKKMQRIHSQENVFKDKKILIVDDDMRNTFSLEMLLSDKGMKVTMADNGQKAIDVLESDPSIDLVLMDIMMPVMDGLVAMRQIRKNKKFESLPIIALTAKAMMEDRQKCIEAGADDYLSKPIDNEKLLSLIRIWLK